MKYTRKHKDRFQFISLQEENRLQLIKYCEWQDCNKEGEYRAPRKRNFLRDFHWFCLEHVRMYNNKWDYFSGCSQNEIEKEIKEDTTWHRPTWPMGIYNGTFYVKDDNYKIFNDKSFKDSNETNTDNKNDNEKKISDAYITLGVNNDAFLPEIKRRYKTLVKIYHPDKNQNEENTSDKLIKINTAYSILLEILS